MLTNRTPEAHRWCGLGPGFCLSEQYLGRRDGDGAAGAQGGVGHAHWLIGYSECGFSDCLALLFLFRCPCPVLWLLWRYYDEWTNTHSGRGGLRIVYLAGLEERIRCCFCAGFMTTWQDLLLNKSHTHTWMTYAPLLARDLDFPEILGLRAPLPALVLSSTADPLFTTSEVRISGQILAEVYARAGAPSAFRLSLYPGGHKLDGPMQAEAFAWLDQWLAG
ncbi:MAG TPA: hypothetical protein VFB38_05925 [Chthonomonadaceae bacterium]|nr:hypothetical protein [Chthonomonadaceae bacterium]